MTELIDKRIAAELESLTASARDARGRALDPPRALAPIGAVSVTAHKSARSATAAGGGVMEDRTETDYTKRTYHVGAYYRSTDGLILLPARKAITFTTESGAEVKDEYAIPPST